MKFCEIYSYKKIFVTITMSVKSNMVELCKSLKKEWCVRNFTKFAAVGVFAAVVCGGVALNVASNGDKTGVYSNRNTQKNEKTAKTAGKSNLLYLVDESGYCGNYSSDKQSYGGCCSSRGGNQNRNDASSSFDADRQQDYGVYNCH